MQLNDWNDFQAFILVAQTGQIARAAQKMGVNATTIGRRLRRLEERLGQTLFEQTRHGQSLTERGEQLLASIESMALTAERVAPKRDATQGPSGNLRISVAEGFGSWFLAGSAKHGRRASRNIPSLSPYHLLLRFNP